MCLYVADPTDSNPEKRAMTVPMHFQGTRPSTGSVWPEGGNQGSSTGLNLLPTLPLLIPDRLIS